MFAFDDVPPAHQPTLAQVRHLLGAHMRHLAGRPRATADPLHLHEIIERLEALAVRAADVPVLRDAIQHRLALLRAERQECTSARLHPPPPAELVACLGARANQQFALYRRLFAGRARLTRRPELAERLYVNLMMVLSELHAIDPAQLPSGDASVRSAALIEKQIDQLRGEGREIVTARSRVPQDELIRQLGADASAETVAYRKQVAGVSPAQVDLELLGGICDRLGEVVFQMAALADVTDDSINLANLRRTARDLAACEQAYAEAHAAQPAPGRS